MRANHPKFRVSIMVAFVAAQMKSGVSYLLGGKARSLKEGPGVTGRIDCSGEFRLLGYHATDGETSMPDGSWLQREYCEKNFDEVPYSQAMEAKAGELYAAFITSGVNGAGRIGHVWNVFYDEKKKRAMTLESHGGKGVNSRPADYKTLRNLVHKCFKLPTESETVQPATPPVAAPNEPALLIWNGQEFPVVFKDGRPYILLRTMVDAMSHRVVKTTDRTGDNPPRYYLTSEPKPKTV